MNYMIQSWMDYPLGNSHIPSKIMFEDDVPFDQVGYVNSLEGIYIYNTRRPQLTLFNLIISETVTSTRLHQPKATKNTPWTTCPNDFLAGQPNPAYMSNRLYLEKNGIACGWKHVFFQIHRAYGNEVGGNPKTR